MASATAQHDMKMAWVKSTCSLASGCDQVKGFCGCNYVALISRPGLLQIPQKECIGIWPSFALNWSIRY